MQALRKLVVQDAVRMESQTFFCHGYHKISVRAKRDNTKLTTSITRHETD